MKIRMLVATLALSVVAASLVGCGKKDKSGSVEGAAGEEGSSETATLPTEEDYEEAAEAKITPATLDAEIAKLEEELKEKPSK